jgi:hypothetical protein
MYENGTFKRNNTLLFHRGEMEKAPNFWATLLFFHRRESETMRRITFFRATMCFPDRRSNETLKITNKY